MAPAPAPAPAPAAATHAELEAWLARIALGDQHAFEQLYRATSAHRLGVAYGVLLHRDRAEEVLQEAYLNVRHAAGSFRGQRATPMTWRINIVRNKAIDRQRVGSALRRARVAIDDDTLLQPERLQA